MVADRLWIEENGGSRLQQPESKLVVFQPAGKRHIEPADLMLESAGGHEYADEDPDSDESGDNDSFDDDNGGVALDEYISSIERDAILKALKETRYNKTAAARKLGITFRALRYKLKKLGVD